MPHDDFRVSITLQDSFHALEDEGDLAHELALWDRLVDEESPDMFSHLSLAQDGGFSEAEELYADMRWFTAIGLVSCVAYNLFAVLKLDISFLLDPEDTVTALGGNVDNINGAFYFSEGIIWWLKHAIAGTELSIQPVTVLGALELIGLVVYFFNIVHCILLIASRDGFRKWFSIQYLCWDVMPALSSYSAMKLLNHVVPSIASARGQELVASFQEARSQGRTGFRVGLNIVQWVFFLAFCFIIGLDTFLMKLRVVATHAFASRISIPTALPCIQFLVQVLGIVQLGPFVRNRLFAFIFGGEDGILQQEEIVLMQTWNALLAKRLYRDLTFPQFLAVMMSFSDKDFQKLVLNEDKTNFCAGEDLSVRSQARSV